MAGCGRLLLVLWAAWACAVLSIYYVYIPRAVFSPIEHLAFDAPAAVAALLLVAAGTWLCGRIATRRGLVVGGGRRTGAVADRAFAVLLVAAGLATVPWWLASSRFRMMLTQVTVPHFPFAGEAAARIVSGLLGASLVCLAAAGAGTLVLRALRWRTSSRVEYLVFAAATGFLAVSFGSFLLAAAGVYRPLAVAVLIGAACLGGAAAIPPCIRTEQAPPPDRPEAVSAAPWLALTAVALAFAAVAALAPEIEYDALWYHLNLPRLWLESGRPVDVVEEYVSLYPLTWDLVFGAGMVLGGVVGAKLLHFVCLPLLAAVVWLAARRYACGAPVAVALVVTTPTMLWEASTAYVDLALALHAAAACYALARYSERDELPWGAMAALQFGGAAATKHLGVIVALVALAIYVVARIRAGHAAGSAARRALVIGLAAALLPMPWYLRSWIASGNPVFPELFAVFGASPPERWDEVTERGLAGFKARFGFGRSLVDLLSLPWDVTVHGARFGGSLGPMFLLLVPAAMIVRRFRSALLAIAAGVVGYAAIWASPFSSYQMRFLMPVVAPMALLAAAGLEGLGTAAGAWMTRGRQLVIAAVFAAAVVNLPPFTRLHERDREGWNGWLTHVLRQAPCAVLVGRESEASYLRRQVPSFAAWQYMNTRLPDDARVLTFVGGDQLYARRRRVPHDSTIARPAVTVGSEDAAAAVAALRRLGVTHVLFDRRELARLHTETLAIGSPAVQRACTTQYDDGRFRVCRLDYSRLPPEPAG